VSGHPKVQATFARVMGYVEQTDIHSPNVSCCSISYDQLCCCSILDHPAVLLPCVRSCTYACALLLFEACLRHSP